MAADKAAPTAAERQDAALRQLLASMRCKQYKRAREACTAALAAGAEPKLMKDYAAVRRDGVRVDAVPTEPPARRRRDPRADRRPSTPSSRSAAAARTTSRRNPRTAPAAAASSSSWPSCC